MTQTEIFLRHIKSFVRRDGRMTEAQRRVLIELWPQCGLNLADGMLDFAKVFGRVAPCILEIGFGSGQSLLEIAKAHPHYDFIGVEMYQPGVGSLLLGVETFGLKNLKVFYADAVEVLKQCIPAASLAGAQIFFPDPWPKRRHHKRRLIQTEFVNLLTEKLHAQGIFHLATDWENYAAQMLQVLSQDAQLKNLAVTGDFAPRSMQRPIVTKFEGRGTNSGRQIWELQFARTDA